MFILKQEGFWLALMFTFLLYCCSLQSYFAGKNDGYRQGKADGYRQGRTAEIKSEGERW